VNDDFDWRKVRREKGTLPIGVIVGSVEIARCEWSQRDRCYRYKLKSPEA
jgi:hypothetical protein